MVAGVAAGIAWRLGVPTAAVRVAFVILAFAGGIGVIAYLALWVVADSAEASAPLPSGPVARRKALALVPMLMGVLVLLRSVGLWFGDGLVWPVALAGAGALIIGSRTDEEPVPAAGRGYGRLARLLDSDGSGSRRRTIARVGAGSLLVAVGMAAFLAATDAVAAVGDVVPAMAATVAGLALIVGPVIFRLGRQLTEERRDRIRSQERSDMAAHLHDSVLQTLAMIQRSTSRAEMVTLARAQERELRSWLFAEPVVEEQQTLRNALDQLVARTEQRFHIAVDAVVVGDAPVTDAIQALVDACGEAVTNAAKHAGVQNVSIYAEVEPENVTVFVRDAGTGFDPVAVPRDRRGISHSICDRVERHGGRATVETAADEGTEWQLQVPLNDARAG